MVVQPSQPNSMTIDEWRELEHFPLVALYEQTDIPEIVEITNSESVTMPR